MGKATNAEDAWHITKARKGIDVKTPVMAAFERDIEQETNAVIAAVLLAANDPIFASDKYKTDAARATILEKAVETGVAAGLGAGAHHAASSALTAAIDVISAQTAEAKRKAVAVSNMELEEVINEVASVTKTIVDTTQTHITEASRLAKFTASSAAEAVILTPEVSIVEGVDEPSVDYAYATNSAKLAVVDMLSRKATAPNLLMARLTALASADRLSSSSKVAEEAEARKLASSAVSTFLSRSGSLSTEEEVAVLMTGLKGDLKSLEEEALAVVASGGPKYLVDDTLETLSKAGDTYISNVLDSAVSAIEATRAAPRDLKVENANLYTSSVIRDITETTNVIIGGIRGAISHSMHAVQEAQIAKDAARAKDVERDVVIDSKIADAMGEVEAARVARDAASAAEARDARYAEAIAAISRDAIKGTVVDSKIANAMATAALVAAELVTPESVASAPLHEVAAAAPAAAPSTPPTSGLSEPAEMTVREKCAINMHIFATKTLPEQLQALEEYNNDFRILSSDPLVRDELIEHPVAAGLNRMNGLIKEIALKPEARDLPETKISLQNAMMQVLDHSTGDNLENRRFVTRHLDKLLSSEMADKGLKPDVTWKFWLADIGKASRGKEPVKAALLEGGDISNLINERHEKPSAAAKHAKLARSASLGYER